MSDIDIKEARGLIENPLLIRVLDELETDAIDKAVGAYPHNEEYQRDGLAIASAVRALRSKLKHLTVEPANPSRKGQKA